MALSVLSQGIAFVPGSAVPVQPSTRVAAASNIVAEEVRRAPLAHAHAEQSAAENTQGRAAVQSMPWQPRKAPSTAASN